MELEAYSIVLLITFFSTSLVEGEHKITFIPPEAKFPVGHKATVKCAQYSKLAKTDKNECKNNFFKPSDYNNEDWDYTAKPGEFPHMVILGKTEEDYACVGVLVSERYVLSVAHCPYYLMKESYGTIWARLGDNGKHPSKDSKAVTIKISHTYIHPFYTPEPITNDISLLQLERGYEFDDLKRPACLNTERDVNGPMFVSGFGIKDGPTDRVSPKLLKTKVNITKEIDDVTKELGPEQQEMFVAAKNLPGMKDSCTGDSGAPLTTSIPSPNCTYKIIGLNSFGKSCAQFASMYTRVSNYINWIESTVWPDYQVIEHPSETETVFRVQF